MLLDHTGNNQGINKGPDKDETTQGPTRQWTTNIGLAKQTEEQHWAAYKEAKHGWTTHGLAKHGRARHCWAEETAKQQKDLMKAHKHEWQKAKNTTKRH